MTVAAAPAPSMFAVFRRRDFTLLWIAQLVSTAGSALTDLAAAIFVWRVTESALAVGLTLMVTAIPSLIVGLLAGVYVDRHDRKRIMVLTCLIQAAVVGLLAIVIGIDTIALPGLYLLLLTNAGVKQFFDPAHDSLIPEVASDEELAAANSFLSIASFGSTAIGFAGAGLLAGSVGLSWAFIIDGATFLFAAGCIALMGTYPMPRPDDDASVAVIIANLKSGMGTLFGTPVIRSLFVVGTLMFFSFGLWNVLLLPFSLKVLGATEFQYGLQEGLTSVGFVAGSLFMARFSKLLPESVWIVVAMVGMGICGIMYGLSTQIGVAIALVTLSGFLNSPSSVSRSVLLQRNTPREMRGRVFSSFYVMRDVVFLFGMAGAGLADILDIRLLVIVSSSLLFVAAAFALVAPGLGVSTWRAATARLRGATAAAEGAAGAFRPATMADFDLLAGRLGAFRRLSPEQRSAFLERAKIVEVTGGTRILEHGGPASSAFFILDGSTTAGIPVDNGFRGLSTMGAGDFFGEIAALTGSLRTADVVADVDTTLLEIPAETLRALMAVPAISDLVLPTLTERLARTTSADLPRLAGLDQQALRDLRTPQPVTEPG
ncbi:MAG: transporter, family, macrolide efflux protein [Chloroflexota bacterium]|jgi:MFS family permease|nr:transporter, family, macrolide efflux protein [Chloroflexota bacterium]